MGVYKYFTSCLLWNTLKNVHVNSELCTDIILWSLLNIYLQFFVWEHQKATCEKAYVSSDSLTFVLCWTCGFGDAILLKVKEYNFVFVGGARLNENICKGFCTSKYSYKTRELIPLSKFLSEKKIMRSGLLTCYRQKTENY